MLQFLTIATTTLVAIVAIAIAIATTITLLIMSIATTIAVATTLVLALWTLSKPMVRAATSMAVSLPATTTAIATSGVLLNQQHNLSCHEWGINFTNISSVTARRMFCNLN
jgi:hypothetical protein